jgi:hypothetical protein
MVNKIKLDLSTSVWCPPTGNHLEFAFAFDGGIRPEWHAALQECDQLIIILLLLIWILLIYLRLLG